MSESIGSKIRQLRLSLELQPEELAKIIGIEPLHLEQIEDGTLMPAISMLIKISRALGVRVGTLLDGTEEAGPVITTETERMTLSCANNAGVEHPNMSFVSLARNKKDRNMEPYFITVNYISDEQGKRSSHEGEEFIYVLEGEITVYYGTKQYVLLSGDSIYYDSVVPHTVSSSSPGTTAKVLAITYTPY